MWNENHYFWFLLTSEFQPGLEQKGVILEILPLSVEIISMQCIGWL